MKLAIKIAVPVFALALLVGYIYLRVQASAQANEITAYADQDLESIPNKGSKNSNERTTMMPGSKSSTVFDFAPTDGSGGKTIYNRAGYPELIDRPSGQQKSSETLKNHQVLSSSKSLTSVISPRMLESSWTFGNSQNGLETIQVCVAKKSIRKGQTIGEGDWEVYPQSVRSLIEFEHEPLHSEQLIGRRAKVEIGPGTVLHANLFEPDSK